MRVHFKLWSRVARVAAGPTGKGKGAKERMVLREETERRTPEKLEVTFTGKGLRTLLDIAERENKPLDEVVESALGLKQWILEVKDEGDEVIVRRGKKDKYKLVL